MRITSIVVMSVVAVLLFTGCVRGPANTGNMHPTSTIDIQLRRDVVGAWTGGEFAEIDINADGTFFSFEPESPSYFGTWALENGVLTFTAKDGTVFRYTDLYRANTTTLRVTDVTTGDVSKWTLIH